MRMPEFRLTGSGIVKMGTVTIIFILIVLMPITAVTVGEVTTVRGISADDMRLVANSGGLYYIDYSGDEPYIRTNDNIYNQYIVTDFTYRPIGVDYEIVGDKIYLYRTSDCVDGCYLEMKFSVDSDQYYITLIDRYYIPWVNVFGWRGNSRERITGQDSSQPIYISNVSDYDVIHLNVFSKEWTDFSSFKIVIYKSDHIIDYIDRPVTYDTLTHTDYNFMGNVIVTGYKTTLLSLDILYKIRFTAIQELFEFVGELFKSVFNISNVFNIF